MTTRCWLPLLGPLAFAAIGCNLTRPRPKPDAEIPVRTPAGTPAAAGTTPREFASQRPMPVPQPPLPPPLPGEPLVPPPRQDAFAGVTPPMPSNGPRDVNPPSPEVTLVGAQVSASTGTPVETAALPPKPSPKPTPIPADKPKPAPADGANLATVKATLAAAQERFAAIPDLECRLIKREVVAGKLLPRDEILFRYRAEPRSVYMRVNSENGQGREALWVSGEPGGMVHVVTGKGDNALVGVGFKTKIKPDDKQATAKSRYRITDAGFGRTLNGLAKAVANAEAGQGTGVKALGLVERPESNYALECVEVTLAPTDDPLLPKGGTRRVYFDTKPDSPAYRLPILIVTTDEANREVEYYSFDRVKAPAKLPAEVWDAAKLGKR